MLMCTLKVLTTTSLLGAMLGLACGQDPTPPGEGGVKELWFQTQTMGYPNPAPLASGSSVYFASGGGSLIARDIETGAQEWDSSIGKSPFSALVEIQGENFILRNNVLVASVEFHVTGLDAHTGSVTWQYSPPLDTIDQTSPRPGYMPRSRIAADDNTV